jgi:hypothetical protein
MKNTEVEIIEKAVVISPLDFGLEEKKANELTKGLETILAEREALKNSYVDVIDLEITEENLKVFKELRLMIVKNRTQGLDIWKKTNKAYFLAAGNFIQAIYNKEVLENELMEDKLKKAEKYFEDLETKRIKDLQNSRAKELEQYELENIEHLSLGIMSSEVWESFKIGTKISHENKIEEAKKIAAEEKAAAEKEAKEKEAAEKQAAEDKAERERLEKEAKLVAEKAEKERLEREQKEALRIAAAAKEKEAAEKILAEQKAKAKEVADKIQKEKDEIEAKLKAKEAAEEKAKIEAAAKIEEELSKDDSAKMQSLKDDLNWLKAKYQFKSKKNLEAYRKTGLLIDKIVNFINEN